LAGYNTRNSATASHEGLKEIKKDGKTRIQKLVLSHPFVYKVQAEQNKIKCMLNTTLFQK
jgi:hypothetical protein